MDAIIVKTILAISTFENATKVSWLGFIAAHISTSQISANFSVNVFMINIYAVCIIKISVFAIKVHLIKKSNLI